MARSLIYYLSEAVALNYRASSVGGSGAISPDKELNSHVTPTDVDATAANVIVATKPSSCFLSMKWFVRIKMAPPLQLVQ